MSQRLRVLITTALAAGALWQVWRWSQHDDYLNLPPTASGPWVAFGDSLTEGFGASEGHDYPTLLSAQLGVPIVNRGRSGDTTEDGLARVEEAAKLRPRVALLCLGGNDGLQGKPQDLMLANLGRLIDRFHREGTFVVLIGVRSPGLHDRYAKPFRRLAREKQVFHVPDILRGILLTPAYKSDPLHPNDEGYRHIAERLAKELRPLLPQLNPP
jgi:lysophospholipase L1-like esterase